MFIQDSSEEEAGKLMRELLRHGNSKLDSGDNSEPKALQFAASKLCITSSKAILIEKRSIRKLLDKIGDDDPIKKKILKYLLYLLKKYGNLMMEEQTEGEGARSFVHPNNRGRSHSCRSTAVESSRGCGHFEAQVDLLNRAVPPEEFKCPISLRLMYDPVVVASGQTFERVWIQKWFDEGNNTCPVTKMNLVHQSLTPNVVMKDLILKWCITHGITIPDPSTYLNVIHSDQSSTSIASFGNSMNDLRLPLDISNVSLGSLDTSYSPHSLHAKVADASNTTLAMGNVESHRRHSLDETGFLLTLSELNWESQNKMVENIKSYLQHSDQTCYSLSSENFVEPLIKFLREAHSLHDLEAQRTGYQLLLAFVSKNRGGISYLNGDAYSLFASFLDSEVTEEVLAVLDVLSGHPHLRSKIAESGALVPIIKILEPQTRKFEEQAIRVLQNLSSNKDICCHIVSLGCIPILVPLLKESSLANHCLSLLKVFCDIEEARVSIAESDECVASIAEILEIGSHDDQEHAVAVLLSLCSQKVQYCHTVMDKGIIPSLVHISMNGTEKAKASACELLRQLRDIKYDAEEDCNGPTFDASRDVSDNSTEKKSSSKASGFFGIKFSMFSKSISRASRKKK
ncbi:U-box domain-containing protein 5 isoform X2 [Tripterygium wilfordii]|nr:U-box domain-containing protein 5 isoform X2 [Tripterygium wilfordii]